ncbi:hypothetical protein Tco_0620771 [Tanacetum coccineum]
MSNSNTNLQTQSSNALHNAIMEAGSKDRPPMLAPGNYVQWKSRIKRYIDTKPNSELIHYCLQNPPYTYQWAEKTVPDTEGSSETTTKRYMENYKNVSQDIRDQLNAEAEAVQIILTGIDNDIYSTVDACPNACEMWKAIERLKQGESINVQDLETNLYWEFGKFTSRDGESLESYYSRFYKMMNELVRNQCHVINHQVNVQFHLQQDGKRMKSMRYELKDLARMLNLACIVGSTTIQFYLPPNPFLLKNTQYSPPDATVYQKQWTKQLLQSSALRMIRTLLTVYEDEEMSKERRLTNSCFNFFCSRKSNITYQQNFELIKPVELIRKFSRINRENGYDHQRAVNVAGARIKELEAQLFVHDLNFKEDKVTQYPMINRIYCYDRSSDGPGMNLLILIKERDLLASLIQEKLIVEIDDSKNRNKFWNHQTEELDDKLKENQSKYSENVEQYFEIQDLKAKLQDKGIAICELKKLIEKMKGKSVETKFEKSSVIRQPNAFKSQRQSILVIPNTSVSRPQHREHHLDDRVMPNNSQGMKQEVEDHTNFWDGEVLGIDQNRTNSWYGDLVSRNDYFKWVYLVEGLDHNLFSLVIFVMRMWKCFRKLPGNP